MEDFYENRDHQLTVRELMELLKNIPEDALVESDGCDCAGETRGISYAKDCNTVLISR